MKLCLAAACCGLVQACAACGADTSSGDIAASPLFSIVRSEPKRRDANLEPGQPSPAQVLARHIEAAGGREALGRIRTLHVRGTFEERGRRISFDLKTKRPGMVLFTMSGLPLLTMRSGVDAEGASWIKMPFKPVKRWIGDTPPMRRGDWPVFLTLPFTLLADFEGPFMTRLATARTEPVLDDPDTSVVAYAAAAPAPMLFVDNKTGLLRSIGSLTILERTTVEGVLMAAAVRDGSRDGGPFRFTSIIANEDMDDAMFAAPDAVDDERH